MDTFVQFVFGWPAIIVTLLLSTAGLIWKRFWLMLIAAVVLGPVSLYISEYPAVHGLGLLLPVCLIGSAFAVRAHRILLGWLLTLPVYLASAWLAILVFSQ
jgi:hypothetical protein